MEKFLTKLKLLQRLFVHHGILNPQLPKLFQNKINIDHKIFVIMKQNHVLLFFYHWKKDITMQNKKLIYRILIQLDILQLQYWD